MSVVGSALLFVTLNDLLMQGRTPVLTVRHGQEVVSLAYSPDGNTLAGVSYPAGVVLWDARTGKALRRIEGPDAGSALAFSPDGKTLATARDWRQGKVGGIIRLWKSATGELVRQLQGDDNLVRCVAFSPDGKRLAAHSQWGTTSKGAVRVWDLATGKELLKIPTQSAGHSVAFSPDGRLLAFDVEYTVRICQAATGKELFRLEGHRLVHQNGGVTSGYINGLAFSPDGWLLASASCDNMARVWDVASGKCLQVLEGHKGFVNAVAFFPDGKTLATGGEDGTLRLWDVASGRQLRQLQAHQVGVHPDDQRKDLFALVFSPDGKRLASGGRDTTVKVWDVPKMLGAGF